jgi:uncharacterized protein YbcV (DUF1398 family)
VGLNPIGCAGYPLSPRLTIWAAPNLHYANVDFKARTVAYYGCNGEEYIEAYTAVEVE